MRKQKVFPLFENVEIIDIASEGKAITRVNDIVVFVKGVIPGDIVDIQVNTKKKSFMEAYPIKFHKYSDKRTNTLCEHFGLCGGCSWQNLKYEEQLYYKQKQVEDNLIRIGKLVNPVISKIIPSDKTFYYRNKLEFTFSNRRWFTDEEMKSGAELLNKSALGFHVPKYFDKVFDVNKCFLQSEISNKIRNSVREFCLNNNYDFFDLRNQNGLMRNIIIRSSTTGDLMVIVVFFKDEKEKRENLLEFMIKQFPEISSLIYVINSKQNDSITDLETYCFYGNPYIMEQMEGLKYKIGPLSFYQTNSEQALNLYKVAREFANLTGNEVVYDLYTGTGTIANFIAKLSSKVVGIEYVPSAIDDAKINSELNNVKNTVFYSGDIAKVLNDEFVIINGKPDVIITDPPRSGMHKDVIDQILKINPLKIVYISCNPATQARDIELLGVKYKVTKIQPVDMFPHTHHVENVVLMEIIPSNV